MNTVSHMEALGFDETTDTGEGTLSVKCSQCEVLVINGVPCHESGCPNQMHECEECMTLVPKGRRLCDGCFEDIHNPEPEPEPEWIIIVTEDRSGEELARYEDDGVGLNDPDYWAERYAMENEFALAKEDGAVPTGCAHFTVTVTCEGCASSHVWTSKSYFKENEA
jgi:hypothetical protein